MAASQGPSNSALLGAAWGLGWRIVVAMFAGYYLDNLFSTAPILTLVLTVAAMVSGVMQILALVGDADDSEDRPPPGTK